MVAAVAAVVEAVVLTLLVAAPAQAAVSRRPQRDVHIDPGPTETMGDADTTPTLNEHTDAKEIWPSTWPQTNLQTNYTWFFLYSLAGNGEPAPPGGSTPGPYPLEKLMPTYDPDFDAHVTRQPKKGDGFMMVCQSYYALVYVRGRYDCSTLIFQEKVWDYYQRKDCLPTPNPEWFWTFPWEPEAIHVIHVRDRSSKRLIIKQTFHCLEVVPPSVKFRMDAGIQWVAYTFPYPTEQEPNLIGYLSYSQSSTGWGEGLVAFVTYNESFPISKPTQPCADFRSNGTFCVLLTDCIGGMHSPQERQDLDVALFTFRITPGPFVPFVLDRFSTERKEIICFWHTGKCPKLPKGPGDPTWRFIRSSDPPTTYEVTTRPTMQHAKYGPEDLMVFQLDSDWIVYTARGYREEDLFIIFFGLLILLLFIFGPLVWFLGRRAGFKNAQARWSYLAAVPGTISVPMGHGGAHWRGRS